MSNKTLATAALLVLLVSGCSLPENDKRNAKNLKKTLDASTTQLADRESKYLALSKTEGFEFYQPYSERENWRSHFDLARVALKQATAYYAEITAILDRDSKDEAPALRQKCLDVEKQLRIVKDESVVVPNRIAFLDDARENASTWVETARGQIADINSKHHLLLARTEEVKDDYPAQREKIDGKLEPLTALHQTANQAFTELAAQYQLVEADQPADYAILGDNCSLLSTTQEERAKAEQAYRAKLDELYNSYLKVLKDMRVDSFVQIGRTSWDDYSDYSTEKNYTYGAVQVDEPTYEYFGNLTETAVVAAHTVGWSGGFKVKVDAGMWAKLGLADKEGWPDGSHDASEFWVADTPQKFYHKYDITTDGATTETDWVEVSAEEFDEQWENLGMALVSKGYGYFEEEALREAAPPAMAFVGNDQYGQWSEPTDGGDRFWEFYEDYMMYSMMTDALYSFSDYDDYHRNYRGRRAYYGTRAGQTPRYGTYSKATAARNSKSSFAKQGGFREAKTSFRSRGNGSVRGAGAARRGGGPGGRGK